MNPKPDTNNGNEGNANKETMTKSRSSSCLLIPKYSPDRFSAMISAQKEEKDRQEEEKRRNLKRKITIVHNEKLPAYSSERFYMLSEIEVKARPLTFLCDFAEDSSTIETEETSTEEGKMGSITPERGEHVASKQRFPPYALLYILWRPEMTTDPKIFTDTVIADAVEQLRIHVNILEKPDVDELASSCHSASSSYSKGHDEQPAINRTNEMANGNGNDIERKPTVNLYLLIDRVMPPTYKCEQEDQFSIPKPQGDEDTKLLQSLHTKQESIARSLARHIASSALRHSFQGLTIGISNHARAAPALEAAVQAVTFGAPDRRRYCEARQILTNADYCSSRFWDRSTIGLITSHPDELLGLQAKNVTDAVQGVLQSKIVAEWNGYGNLNSYSVRAHHSWRKLVGLPQAKVSPHEKRKIPRRIARQPMTMRSTSAGNPPGRRNNLFVHSELRRQQRDREIVYDTVAAIMIIFYLLFHFHRAIDEKVHWLCMQMLGIIE